MTDEKPTLTRLKRRSEFLAAAKAAYCARGAILIQLRNRGDGSPEIRVGFTATRKIGGAVIRNHAKRKLREVARALLPDLGLGGCDYVFIARSGAPDRPLTQLLDDARKALGQLSRQADGDAPARNAQRAPKDRPPHEGVLP